VLHASGAFCFWATYGHRVKSLMVAQFFVFVSVYLTENTLISKG